MDEDLEKELNDIFLPYVEKAIKDNPPNYVSHATEYFTKLRDEKKTREVKLHEGSKEHIRKALGHRCIRRGTIMGEKYNPEEDDDTDDIEIVPKSDELRDRIISQCEDIFLFRVLDKIDLYAVIDAIKPISVEEGDIIIKQGDDGDYFYLIDKGEFSAYILDPKGIDKLVMSYKDKGFFGELALLHNQPRAATIKATSEGLLWAVSRKTSNKLIVKIAFEKRQLYVQLLDGVSLLKPYLIDKGEFSAYILDPKRIDKLVMSYKDKGFFGELALLHNQSRAATIKAISEGLLWAVSRKTFNKLIVKRAFEKRQLYVQLLNGVSQLKPSTEYEKMQVADALRGKSYSKGDVIVKEGDKGDGMYFIVEGKISVRIKSGSDENIPYKEVNELRNGDYFGGRIKHRVL